MKPKKSLAFIKTIFMVLVLSFKVSGGQLLILVRLLLLEIMPFIPQKSY
jgi:hypothetical protein